MFVLYIIYILSELLKYIYTHKNTYLHIWVCIYKHIYVHTHTHTHTHAHTLLFPRYPCWKHSLQYFLLVFSLSFHPINRVSHREIFFFILMRSIQFINFSFYGFTFGIKFKKSFPGSRP